MDWPTILTGEVLMEARRFSNGLKIEAMVIDSKVWLAVLSN